MSLSAVVKEVNWNALFTNGRQIDPKFITVGDAVKIFRHIDSELSPENLCCDGELSPAKVRAKHKKLIKALQTLRLKGFRPPADCSF